MIPIPFIWVLVRFIRSLWLSLKDPEFQASSSLSLLPSRREQCSTGWPRGGACSTLSTSALSR